MGDTGFTEHLRVPWWWWPVALGVSGLLATEIGFGVPGVRTWLAYAVVLPLTALLLWWAGRLPVRLVPGDGHGRLEVDDASLPLQHVAAVRVLTGTERRTALGPELDPLAFVIQRPWIDPVVQILIDDPADPTPYWIVSTRRPEQLRAALDAVVSARQIGGDRLAQ